jgi:hypothetical protein
MRVKLLVGGLAATAVLVVVGFALAHEKSEPVGSSASGPSGSTACTQQTRPPAVHQPRWYTAHHAMVLVDSVLLGGMDALRRNLPRWHIVQAGRPAIMVHTLNDELRGRAGRVPPLVIVGVGYDSLWERNRVRYGIWAKEFDDQARELLATLKRGGAQQFVWVTLRLPTRGDTPSGAWWQIDKYAWYFSYVNEQLRKIDRRRSDLVLANWTKVSNRPGLTYDSIHLNLKGAALMAKTIKSTIRTEARRQALATHHPRRGC